MGNSASEIVSRVSGSSYEESKKLLNQDIELLHDTSIVFSTAKLSIRSDLSSYKTGSESSKKAEVLTTDSEQSLIFSHQNQHLAQDRIDSAVNILIKDISQTTEIDVASAEITKRLQAFCRIFEAILRVEDSKKKKPANGLNQGPADQLPAAAKAAIKFGLSTLLNLIKYVAGANPQLFEFAINDANLSLSQSQPLSLLTSDSTLLATFEKISDFFDSVICGNIKSLPAEMSNQAIVPFFKLALASGSISCFLMFSKRLLSLKDLTIETKAALFPLLKSLDSIPISGNLHRWSLAGKGDNVLVNGDVVSGAVDNEDGIVYIEHEYSNSKAYFEIQVNRSNENCHFGISAVEFNEKSSWNNSSYTTLVFGSNSSVYSKTDESFKIEPWAVNDKIGVFVDLERKTVTFFRNGEKQKNPPLPFTQDKYKVYLHINKNSEFTLNRSLEYPEELKDFLLVTKPVISDFQTMLGQASPSEEFLSKPLGESLAFILKKLSDGLIPIEYLFQTRNYKFENKRPSYSFQISTNTFKYLQEIQSVLYDLLRSSDFSLISEESLKSSIFSIQRLIMFHLLLSEQLEDKSLLEDTKKKILDKTIHFIQTSTHPDLSKEAIKLLSSCFEIFYKDPSVKLKYINEGLERDDSQQEVKVLEELEAKVFQTIARPDILFPILDHIDESHISEIKRFYKNLLQKSQKATEGILKSDFSKLSALKLLSCAQAALFSQSGKNEFKGKYIEILSDYSISFLIAVRDTLQSCQDLLRSATDEEIILKTSKSIIGSILEELLCSLILTPLSSSIISEVLPLVSEIADLFARVPAGKSILTLGIGVVEEIYESPHNYLDNSQLKHTIKVPSAIKYTLVFDSQCKTENGCDYLELWLDENASNKFARWEGENFPKEPVEVTNPLLHFTFRSDGSVNYWGWKITIKALVESTYYKKQWPETSKDNIELFFGKCSAKMINGDLEKVEIEEEVKLSLSNPLFEYGIHDSALAFVADLPGINENISKISSHILRPAEYLVSPALRKFSYLPDYEVGLREYLDYYNSIKEKSFAENPFLCKFLDGEEDLVKSWTALKKKSGVTGNSFSIGGEDLDQAERAIFSVYVSFFEISETAKEILTGKLDAGATVKNIVKESCQIRTWAQKHKQKLYDGGKTDITYKLINDDIIKKCAILIGSDYKSALSHIGISKILKNLTSDIAKGQKTGLQKNSKWKNVQGALKSVHKLTSLVSIKKKSTKPENEDYKELSRVIELVKKFLENTVPVEKIIGALNTRRSAAIIKSLGFLSISKLISYSSSEHETFVVKSFSDSLKVENSKITYLQNTTGLDPLLIQSIQKGFFLVVRSIQEDIIASAHSVFNFELFSHFTTAVEALSWQYRGEDIHQLIPQPLSALLKTLLKWAKGDVSQEPVQRKFLSEKCVTRIGLITEEALSEGKTTVLIEKPEGQPGLYLCLDFGGENLPITTYEITEEIKEGLEEAVPEFLHQGVRKRIYVERKEAEPKKEYLIGIDEALQGKFEKHENLLGEANVEEVKKLLKMKENLAKNCWSLFKQLAYTLVGAWKGTSELNHLAIQEKFLKVIFDELQGVIETGNSGVLNVKNLISGETWVGSGKILRENRKKMEAWVERFTCDKEVELAELVNGYISYVDPLSTGKVDLPDCEFLTDQVEEYKEDGKISFFKFLELVKAAASQAEGLENIKKYIQEKEFWNNWEVRTEVVDYSDVKTIIKKLESHFNPSEEALFTPYLNLVKDSNGLVPSNKLPENTVAEFKLSDGQLDLYHMLSEIKNNSKFSKYFSEIKDFYPAHELLPASLEDLKASKSLTNDYSASLLLVLYGCFTSSVLPKAISKAEYTKTLMSYLKTPSCISTFVLSSRILSKVLPSQHSPSTVSPIYLSLNLDSDYPCFITFLLNQLGRSIMVTEDQRLGYESRNLLISLLQENRWKDQITDILLSAHRKAAESLEKNQVLDCVQIGSVLLLSNSFYTAKVPFALSVVSLRETAFSWGIVKEVQPDDKILVYSIIDDNSAAVELTKIVSIDNSLNVFPLKLIPSTAEVCENLFVLWKGLQKSFSSPLNTSNEGFVLFSLIYKVLQNVILTCLKDAFDQIDLDGEKLANVVLDLIDVKPSKENVSNLDYINAVKAIKGKFESLAVDEEKAKIEEVEEQVNLLEDDGKNAHRLLVDGGLSPQFALKCVKAGVKDLEGARNYKEGVQSTLLSKLSLIDEVGVLYEDPDGSAEMYQNNYFHLIISDTHNSYKSLEFDISSKIFESLTYFTPEITLRLGLEFAPLDSHLNAGLLIGNSELRFSSETVSVSGSTFAINTNTAVVLRLNSKSSGEVKVTLENTGESVELFDRSIFTGYSVGKFKLYLESGALASIVMLEIHNLNISSNFQGKIEKSAKSDHSERFVKIKSKLPDSSIARLKLLGITEKEAEICRSSTSNISEAVRFSLDSFSPSERFSQSSDIISEIKLFEKPEDIPSDFSRVKVFENFKETDLEFTGRKILAFKKSTNETGLLGLSLAEAAGFESLGELNPGDTKVFSVYHKTGKTSQKDPALNSLIYVKSYSINNVKVPRNFNILTDKEGKAINIAPKSDKPFYLFIAYNKTVEFLSVPVYKLESIPPKFTTFGLVESQKLSPDKKEKGLDLSSYSLTSLFALLNSYEQNNLAKLTESLILTALQKSLKYFNSLIQVIPLSKVFIFLNSDFVKSLKLDEAEEGIVGSLIQESVLSLLSTLIPKTSSGRQLKSVHVESTHPYDNNMDVDDVITIPGASGLRIEFDSQCYTESGCDPLRFYEGPNRSGELKCYSGQGESIWQAFEVPGDTVYTYFHSDGSVNYWGYKFEVIPLGSSGQIEKTNISVALQLILKASQDQKLKNLIKTDKILFPLFSFLLGSFNLEEKLQVLEIFKSVIEGLKSDLGKSIIDYLNTSAEALYKATMNDKASHNVLQALIQVLFEGQKQGITKLTSNWFLDLSDLLSDMNGLTDKNKHLDMFLFDIFKGTSGSKLELSFESEHPYFIKTQSKKINFAGAYSLNIEFSQDSKAENKHTVFFSKHCTNAENALEDTSTVDAKSKWEVKGPDIEFSNDGLRVTRTNSNSWGAALMPIKLTSGITTFTYLIEQDGGSEYLYIGFIETNDPNSVDLTSCFNSDLGKKIWTWKKNGDMHVQGSNTKSETYGTGDVIKMTVNFELSTVTCFKNNVEVYKFQNIGSSLVPLISFGGSNQFVQLKSVEKLNESSIENKKLKILGDTTYLWFPVNSGYFNRYRWDHMTDAACIVSSDYLTLTKLTEDSLVVPVFGNYSFGKNYFQVLIKKGGALALGVGSSELVDSKNWQNENISVIWSDQEPGFKDGDVVGVLLDFYNNLIEFYVNRNSVLRLSGKVLDTNHKFFVILKSQNSEIQVKNEDPSWLDILKIESEEVSKEIGYKIKVLPEFKGRSWTAIELFLESNSQEFKDSWEAYRGTFSNIFKSGAAEELVIFLDQFCATTSKDPCGLTQEDFVIKKSDLIYYPELEKVEDGNLFKLYQVLQNFNKRVQSSLYLFDLNFKSSLTDMQKFLIGSRNFIMFNTKNNLLKGIMDKTKNDARTEITIDRPKAARHRNKKEVDTEGQFSIFGQIFRALSAVPNLNLRNPERIYKVNYRGEGSIDAGGPYNESMSNMCDELMSSFLRLLIPTSNNSNNMGENRDSWIVNPSATGQTDLDMYKFLGKLMGAAIRTQNNLNLSLPPLFWKTLLREKLTVKDLRSADACIVQILEILKNPAANELTPDNFSMVYEEKFTTKDSSGREVEVKAGGKLEDVTFENCGEYADLVLEARLSESQKVYVAIREGLSGVVPVDYLNLMSYKQLETLVCGAANVDIDILKENTDYEGCAATDPHIVMFWDVLKAFAPRERTLFLKFVWGRTKLPAGKDWRHMKVTRLQPSGPVNNYMPISHTCFFTLDLPAYTTKEAMEQKLLYAITHCTAIDLDGRAGEGWEDHD